MGLVVVAGVERLAEPVRAVAVVSPGTKPLMVAVSDGLAVPDALVLSSARTVSCLAVMFAASPIGAMT
ncbi:hypothetical protein EBR04_07945 [bacterium]|nr:hypothetical protein [bacterium]